MRATSTVKVFISSRQEELTRERQAAEHAIESLGNMPFRFEITPAEPGAPQHVALREVRDSEVFIQILGRSLSAAVQEEYDAAVESKPHNIIVFVKDGPKDAAMQRHIETIKRRHKYRVFSTPDQLGKEVRAALQALMVEALRTAGGKRARLDMTNETIVDDRISLKSYTPMWYEISVAPGDRIKGLARAEDNFDLLLMDELTFAVWLQKRGVKPLGGGTEKSSHAFDAIAKKLDIWYAGLYTRAWFGPVEVHITIRRMAD